MLYKRPIFYVPFSFFAGPLLAGLLNTDSALIAMGPFFLSLIFWIVNRYNQEKAEEKVSPSGKLVCLSCESRFDKPKMRGNDWIEVVLYIFLFIIGGVIYSIWRRSGNGECSVWLARLPAIHGNYGRFIRQKRRDRLPVLRRKNSGESNYMQALWKASKGGYSAYLKPEKYIRKIYQVRPRFRNISGIYQGQTTVSYYL